MRRLRDSLHNWLSKCKAAKFQFFTLISACESERELIRRQKYVFWIFTGFTGVLLLYFFFQSDFYFNLYWHLLALIFSVSFLRKILNRNIFLVRILAFFILFSWLLLILIYFMFLKTNSGGFNLENIYHLFCIQGWVDSFLMNPMLLVSGGTALIVAIALSYWLTVVLAWSIGKQEGKSATVVYSCLLLLFLWFFVRDNIVLVQLHGIIQDMRIARKYVTFDEKTFKSCGIKLFPLPWQYVKATRGKNLVYIILESTELTFLDQKRFPGLLPNLYRFHESAQSFENLSMAHNAKLTFGGVYSAMTGSYLTPAHLKRGENKWWDPNVSSYFSSLPRILHNAGYEQHFLVGHSGHFAGTESFIKDQQYDVFWSPIEREKREADWTFSVRDSVVFEQAWRDFQALAERDVPFNLTLLTIDAHGPDGFYSPDELSYPGPLKESNLYHAMFASDYALGNFLQKIKAHPKYKDTCIVITCDHLAHSYTSCTDILEQNPERRLLFLIDNSSVDSYDSTVPGKTFDIGPTILDALGVSHNYKFPLGESLYGNPDMSRLDCTPEQKRAFYSYVLLKNQVQRLEYPLEISLKEIPFPYMQINSQRFPLVIKEVNDIPRKGEVIVFLLPQANRSAELEMRYFDSRDSFQNFLKTNPADVVFTGKEPLLREVSEKASHDSVEPFFLGYRIGKKEKIVYGRELSKLNLYCE